MRLSSLVPVLLAAILGLASPARAEDVIYPPTGPSNGSLVVSIHGAGGDAHLLDGDPKRLVSTLTDAGFTVASSDGGGKFTWGGEVATDAYLHLIRSTPHRHLFFMGGSMGALTMIKLIPLVHPEAMVMTYPLCEPRALGEPVRRMAKEHWPNGRPKGPRADVAGLPVLIFASPEDTWVPKVHNADNCARWMRRGGARVREISTTGEHGDPSNVRPQWIADLFEDQLPG